MYNMLTCNCVAAEQFSSYFTRLQYGLKPGCTDYLRLVKIAQLLTFLQSISSEDCAEDLKCLYEELNCS